MVFLDLYAIIKATEKLERAYVRGESRNSSNFATTMRPCMSSGHAAKHLKPNVCSADAIRSDEYETICEKLIQQFKVLHGSLKGAVRVPSPIRSLGALAASRHCLPLALLQVPDVEKFMSEYNMQCPMAATRLLHSGLPATIEHKTKQRSNDPESASVRSFSCLCTHSYEYMTRPASTIWSA